VLDELIGDPVAADVVCGPAFTVEGFENRGSEPAHGQMLFQCEDARRRFPEMPQEIAIQWLGESGLGYAAFESATGQKARRVLRDGYHRSVGEQREIFSLAKNLAAADLEQLELRVERDTEPRSARVADGERAARRNRGEDQVLQLVFIFGR